MFEALKNSICLHTDKSVLKLTLLDWNMSIGHRTPDIMKIRRRIIISDVHKMHDSYFSLNFIIFVDFCFLFFIYLFVYSFFNATFLMHLF